MLFGAVGSRFSGLNGHLQAELVAQRHELVDTQCPWRTFELRQSSLTEAEPPSQLRLSELLILATATQKRSELGWGCQWLDSCRHKYCLFQ